MSKPIERVEIITGRERRRRYTAEERVRLIEQTGVGVDLVSWTPRGLRWRCPTRWPLASLVRCGLCKGPMSVIGCGGWLGCLTSPHRLVRAEFQCGQLPLGGPGGILVDEPAHPN